MPPSSRTLVSYTYELDRLCTANRLASQHWLYGYTYQLLCPVFSLANKSRDLFRDDNHCEAHAQQTLAHASAEGIEPEAMRYCSLRICTGAAPLIRTHPVVEVTENQVFKVYIPLAVMVTTGCYLVRPDL